MFDGGIVHFFMHHAWVTDVAASKEVFAFVHLLDGTGMGIEHGYHPLLFPVGEISDPLSSLVSPVGKHRQKTLAILNNLHAKNVGRINVCIYKKGDFDTQNKHHEQRITGEGRNEEVARAGVRKQNPVLLNRQPIGIYKNAQDTTTTTATSHSIEDVQTSITKGW